MGQMTSYMRSKQEREFAFNMRSRAHIRWVWVGTWPLGVALGWRKLYVGNLLALVWAWRRMLACVARIHPLHHFHSCYRLMSHIHQSGPYCGTFSAFCRCDLTNRLLTSHSSSSCTCVFLFQTCHRCLCGHDSTY